jgi:hypothetical protein
MRTADRIAFVGVWLSAAALAVSFGALLVSLRGDERQQKQTEQAVANEVALLQKEDAATIENRSKQPIRILEVGAE